MTGAENVEPSPGRPDQGPPRWPGDTRPPFLPGNRAAVGHGRPVTHGAWSPRHVDPIAQELLDHVLAEAAEPGSPTAFLLERRFRYALVAWARAEARVALLTDWLSKHGGEVTDDGEVQAAAVLLTRIDTQAQRHRDALGLTPKAAAAMGRDVAAGAVDMAKVMAGIEAAERALADRDATETTGHEPATHDTDDDEDDRDDDE